MKALILAAGEGTRLRPLTLHRPKPMVEIAGAPIIEHNIRLLVRHGVRDIVINLWHAPELIVEHFGDGSRVGAAIEYSREEQLLGTAGALKRAAALFAFEEDFLVVYGDNVSTCDLTALLDTHRAKNALVTVALHERGAPEAGGVAEQDPDGRLVRFVEKPALAGGIKAWVNAGYLAMSPEVLELIPDEVPSDLSRDVLEPLVARGERVFGHRLNGGLWWIDSLEDYERTQQWFASEAARASLRAELGEPNVGATTR